MFEHPDNIYKNILLNNLKKNNIQIWLDAGGGHNTGLEKEDPQPIKNIKIISCDRDQSSLDKNKFADKKLLCNLEKIPLEDNYADVITLRMVMEHLENPKKVLKELSRILRAEGKLIIYTPNSNNYLVLIAKYFPNFYKEVIKKGEWMMEEESMYTHYYRMNTRDTIKSYLNRFNLDEIEFYYPPCTTLAKKNRLFYFEYFLVCFLNIFKIFNANILGVYQKNKS